MGYVIIKCVTIDKKVYSVWYVLTFIVIVQKCQTTVMDEKIISLALS